MWYLMASWQGCFRNAKMVGRIPKSWLDAIPQIHCVDIPAFSHCCFSLHYAFELPGFVHIYSFGLLHASVLISEAYI